MAGRPVGGDHRPVIGHRLPALRQALTELGEQLLPGQQQERQAAEPVERIAAEALAARIGAQSPDARSTMSSGNAPWRRALRD